MAAPKVSGIYEIVNLVNGKRYVGSAVDVRRRWGQHRRYLRQGSHANQHLQSSFNKNGEDAFTFRILEECAPAILIEREQAAIDRLRPELNICPVAGSTAGRVHSEDTRRKISAKRAGAKMPPRSEDHCAAISAGQRGKPKSPEHIAALQLGRRNRTITEEENAKRSESLRLAYADGRHRRDRPAEYREKIAETLRGRKATPEHRANQAAAQRGKKRGPYKLDPAKAEARREAGRRLAALRNGSRS